MTEYILFAAFTVLVFLIGVTLGHIRIQDRVQMLQDVCQIVILLSTAQHVFINSLQAVYDSAKDRLTEEERKQIVDALRKYDLARRLVEKDSIE